MKQPQRPGAVQKNDCGFVKRGRSLPFNNHQRAITFKGSQQSHIVQGFRRMSGRGSRFSVISEQGG